MRTKDETFRGTTSIRQKWRSLRLTKIRLIDNGIFRAGLVSHGQNELTIGFFGNLPGDVRRGRCGSFQRVASFSISVTTAYSSRIKVL
jgi:hypothetical protein